MTMWAGVYFFLQKKYENKQATNVLEFLEQQELSRGSGEVSSFISFTGDKRKYKSYMDFKHENKD